MDRVRYLATAPISPGRTGVLYPLGAPASFTIFSTVITERFFVSRSGVIVVEVGFVNSTVCVVFSCGM